MNVDFLTWWRPTALGWVEPERTLSPLPEKLSFRARHSLNLELRSTGRLWPSRAGHPTAVNGNSAPLC